MMRITKKAFLKMSPDPPPHMGVWNKTTIVFFVGFGYSDFTGVFYQFMLLSSIHCSTHSCVLRVIVLYEFVTTGVDFLDNGKQHYIQDLDK